MEGEGGSGRDIEGEGRWQRWSTAKVDVKINSKVTSLVEDGGRRKMEVEDAGG
jgi:hypothetical protein